MKVLILTNVYVGLYKFRIELLEKLVSHNYDVYVVAPNDDYAEKIQKVGCQTKDIRMDRRGSNPIRDFSIVLQYIKDIKRIDPDIILTYTIKPNIYGGIAAKLCHKKYIANITGLSTVIEKKGLTSTILLKLYKMGVKNACQIMFQNENNMRSFEQGGTVKKGRLIPGSGVNLKEHYYEEYPKDDGNTIKLLFVGRIMKDKGIEEYIECAKYITSKYNNIEFSIVGGYDEERYSETIDELNEKGVIKYYGSQEDVHSFYKRHHALIQPSYHEGLSNVLLENAACGRPCVSTNVPGCKEAFEEGVTGIGFRPKDSNALIKAVELFIALPYETKVRMGILARQKMEKEFNRDIVIDAYMEEISKAVGDK